MEVLITATGTENVNRRFSRFVRQAGNMEEAFVLVSESLAKTNKRNWGRGVHLAQSTLAKKAAAGKTDPLVWSGALKRSLTEPSAPHAIREIRPMEMRFGTGVFWARFQQYGTRNMPRHRVLRFTVTAKRLVRELLREHLMN